MEEWLQNIEEQITHREEKEKVAKRVAEKVQNGQVIGAGSGSTSWLVVKAIAKRIQEEHLQIAMIPTSYEVEVLCRSLEIPVTSLLSQKPDWSFDGADEVDSKGNVLKGRGGAMFKEKLNMVQSPVTYIVVDSSKFVEKLGTHFPVPVECDRLAVPYVTQQLYKLGASHVILRKAVAKDGPVFTENNHVILDATFAEITETLEKDIKTITGVIETGLCQQYPVVIEK